MTDYDNTNRGAIWKNEHREKNTHPHFTGSINVEGVEYWLSAWKRKEGSSEKSPVLSLSIKRKDAGNQQDYRAHTESNQQSNTYEMQSTSHQMDDGGFEDDIPF